MTEDSDPCLSCPLAECNDRSPVCGINLASAAKTRLQRAFNAIMKALNDERV